MTILKILTKKSKFLAVVSYENNFFCWRAYFFFYPFSDVHRCGATGSMRASHAAGPVGTGFLGEVFSWFFLTCKTNVGKLQAHKVPEYHLAAVIIIPYSPCWYEWVCAWCVSYYMFVLSRRWPRHRADHSSGEALHVLVWSKKYVCDPQFSSLPRQVVAL